MIIGAGVYFSTMQEMAQPSKDKRQSSLPRLCWESLHRNKSKRFCNMTAEFVTVARVSEIV